MFIQCSGDIWHSYSTQASKLSFVLCIETLVCPMCWWPLSLSEMWSDWTEVLVVAVALDQSGVQSIIPPRPFWLSELSLTQQKVNRDSTWQWKLLAEQLYVCLIDSSSVFHLCGWEWPCGSICALCLRLPSFGHSVIWLSSFASRFKRIAWKHFRNYYN